jgi:hypothetical protein
MFYNCGYLAKQDNRLSKMPKKKKSYLYYSNLVYPKSLIQKYLLGEKGLNTNEIKIHVIYSQEHTCVSDSCTLNLEISLI